MNKEVYNKARKDKDIDEFLFWYYNRHGGIIRHPIQFKVWLRKWLEKKGNTVSISALKTILILYLDRKHLHS